MNDDLTRSLSTWAARAAAALVLLAGLGAVALGLVLVIQDEASHSDEWDGFGTFLGAVAGGTGLVLVTFSVVALWLTQRHLLGAAVLLCAFGVLVAGAGWVALGATGVMVSAPLVLGGLLIAGVAFGAALGASRVTIDSPGGYAR